MSRVMDYLRSHITAVLFLALLCLSAALATEALAGNATTALTKQDLREWTAKFPITGSQIQRIGITQQVGPGGDLHPFSGGAVLGVAITGTVRLESKRSMVRVVLVDDQQKEYLVYETYPLLAGGSTLNLQSVCRETCALPAIVPSTLKVELVDASLDLQSVLENRSAPNDRSRPEIAARMKQQMEQIKKEQDAQIVEVLNDHIKAKGLRWTAGETSLSRLPFAERNLLIACSKGGLGTGPNTQGAEFYKGGIFVVESGSSTSSVSANDSSSLVESFDWRSRHGANRPGSPYYNGSNGWMTPVESQMCSDCWAHSALGATEAQANLYFNQHLDLDLSEQELVDCSGAGSCANGGNTGVALSFVQNYGVVNEACYPGTGLDGTCSACPVPQDKISIAGFDAFYPQDEQDIQKRLIKYGPLPFGIASWWHAMVLSGYEHDATTGETVWILKNSWGLDWGDQGYGYVVVPLSDIYLTYNLYSPVTSLVKSYSVQCRDADGDGYYNWGMSATPPESCGNVPPIEDCDDSDPTVAVMTEDGRCTAVQDKTPPAVVASARPSILWPANGTTVPVLVTGTIKDTDSGVDASKTAYTVQDEYGSITPSGGIQLGSDGSYAVTVPLQASRLASDTDGRHYTITVSARDNAGNVGSNSVVVTVPQVMPSGCHIGYTIITQWNPGFLVALSIDNEGSTPITGWTLTWTFGDGQTVTQLWNGAETQSGANVTVRDLGYNANIPPGGSYKDAGFLATWNNATNSVPTGFALNGMACTVN